MFEKKIQRPTFPTIEDGQQHRAFAAPSLAIFFPLAFLIAIEWKALTETIPWLWWIGGGAILLLLLLLSLALARRRPKAVYCLRCGHRIKAGEPCPYCGAAGEFQKPDTR
jgi:hypothetical protein